MCEKCGDDGCSECYDDWEEFEWYEVTKAFLEKQILKPTEH